VRLTDGALLVRGATVRDVGGVWWAGAGPVCVACRLGRCAWARPWPAGGLPRRVRHRDL